MQARQRFGQPLIVVDQPPKPCHPAKAALDDPAARQQDKATLSRGEFDDLQPNAVGGRRRDRLRTRVALIDKGHLHRLARDILHLCSQFRDLCPLLLIRGRDQHRQQLPEGSDGDLDLAAVAPFVSILACTTPAFRAGLERPGIEDHRAWLGRTICDCAQQRTYIMHQRFKHAGVQPAPSLLIDRTPRWPVVRQHAPLRARPCNPTHAIKDLA